MFLREYFQTVFQGLQDFKLFNTAMVVNQLGILAFVAVFVLIFRLGLEGAILAFIAGNLINVVYMVYQLKKGINCALIFGDSHGSTSENPLNMD